MKTAAKILLAPIWLLTAALRLACKLATGIGVYVLTIGGGLLLVYDLLLVILRMSSKELWLQLFAIAGAMLAIPTIIRVFLTRIFLYLKCLKVNDHKVFLKICILT